MPTANCHLWSVPNSGRMMLHVGATQLSPPDNETDGDWLRASARGIVVAFANEGVWGADGTCTGTRVGGRHRSCGWLSKTLSSIVLYGPMWPGLSPRTICANQSTIRSPLAVVV